MEEEELNLDEIDRELEFLDDNEEDEDEEIDFYDKLSSDLVQDVPDDLKENFVERLEESLSMFKRIIN